MDLAERMRRWSGFSSAWIHREAPQDGEGVMSQFCPFCQSRPLTETICYRNVRQDYCGHPDCKKYVQAELQRKLELRKLTETATALGEACAKAQATEVFNLLARRLDGPHPRCIVSQRLMMTKDVTRIELADGTVIDWLREWGPPPALGERMYVVRQQERRDTSAQVTEETEPSKIETDTYKAHRHSLMAKEVEFFSKLHTIPDYLPPRIRERRQHQCHVSRPSMNSVDDDHLIPDATELTMSGRLK